MGARTLADTAPATVLGTWASPRARQILVVDDDPLVRETLGHIIAALGGGEVIQASGGMEAIRLIKADPERFDLVFCDLQMPGSDGIDVLEACAAAGMHENVVLMSGSGESNLREAEADAAAWRSALMRTMAKPFSVAEVKALLAHRAPAS